MTTTPHWLDRATLRTLAALRRLRRTIVPELLEYAPQGWSTPLPADEQGWLAPQVLAEEQRKWDEFAALVRQPGPLGFSHDAASLQETADLKWHNLNLTFGYVVALAATGRDRLSVLDWGGGLGYYYLLARAFLPEGIALDYHCKDVATLVRAGRQLAPQVIWHEDDRCLEQQYDLVVISGALQYCREWQALLKKVRGATRRYLYLTRTPVVRGTASFVAVQRAYGTRMLHQQFNEDELLTTTRALEFKLVREFVTGDPCYIRNAPQDAVLKGWLFSV